MVIGNVVQFFQVYSGFFHAIPGGTYRLQTLSKFESRLLAIKQGRALALIVARTMRRETAISSKTASRIDIRPWALYRAPPAELPATIPGDL